jgi:enterochelin esterase-like enzyme
MQKITESLQEEIMHLKLISTLLLIAALGTVAEEVRWPVPPSGFSSRKNNIPHGTMSDVLKYKATGFSDEKPIKVYTPPNYSAITATKYPVLYLLHGIGGNESAWTSSEGNADNVMDFLYSENKAVPMIVVMPHGGTFGGDDFARFAKFEDVLIKDLIPYIEKTFNASPDSNMRAIAGLSMGGGQTLNFGYKYPKVFTWIGAFSPAPNTASAATTITDMTSVKANIHLNFLAAGTAESMFLTTARTYHDYLNQNGVKNLYLQVEQGLNHEPENWNRQLYNFAQRIFQGITTNVAQPEHNKLVPVAKASVSTQKMLISRNSGADSKPWGVFIAQTENTSSQVYTLTGRTTTTFRDLNVSIPTSRNIK